jgi:DNA-binding NarL/FixJ family response regulator
MNKEITIVIADDHLICRQGLKQVLETVKEFKVIGEAGNGRALVEMCALLKPAVVITDRLMPGMDGLMAIRQIIKMPYVPALLVMSVMEEEMDAYEALAAGAQGYLQKAAQRNEIKEAIETVLYSNRYYCSIKSEWLLSLIKQYPYPLMPVEQTAFTDREMEVMQLLQEQMTSGEIGEELFISSKTVNGHRNQLLKKTGSKNVIGIVLYAIKNRLIKLSK